MIPKYDTDTIILADLRLFTVAATMPSLAEAAQQLRLSRASASRQLQRLEIGVGLQLILRDARRFSLTEAGLAFLPLATKALAAVTEAVEAAHHEPGKLGGHLRIAAPYTYGRRSIGPILPKFMAIHPNLKVTLDLGSRHSDVLRDEVDIAIRIGNPGSDNLVTRLLATEPFLLCATPAYLSDNPAPAEPDDLVRHRILDTRTDTTSRFLEFSRGDQVVRVNLDPVMACNDPEVLAQAVRQGAGISVLPYSFVDTDLACGALLVVLPDWKLPSRSVNAAYAPGRRHSPKIRAFLDFLTAQIRQHAKAGCVK